MNLSLSLKFSKNSSRSRFGWEESFGFLKCKNVKGQSNHWGLDSRKSSITKLSRSNGSRLPDPNRRRASRQSYTDLPDFGDRQPFQFQGTAVKFALAPFITTPLLSVTSNGRTSAKIHRGFQHATAQHSAWWFVFDESPHANLVTLPSSFASSLSLSVRGNLFRSTCKPSAIGSEANLKRGASSTEFSELLRDSFRATCETRSFFHASPPLSRSSIFFACFSLLAFLALLAYFFALLFLTCFPSLYCTDTNDGIENSTFSFSFSNGIK